MGVTDMWDVSKAPAVWPFTAFLMRQRRWVREAVYKRAMEFKKQLPGEYVGIHIRHGDKEY
jgi:hypothetical protein